ncbi:hypothetical protein N7493_003777 [Penicillium malachiteum]|uniref:Uncharacterized protein n=1 Tax=Penicillium malachiteum TaxID=1324776 RepID=A0AAD6HQY8_9EURO|nr:hypothetical protein N7493_003777 [Penicillium malachiteum]
MEILVHVSAPSTIQDDARYRAHVAAILAFQTSQQEQVTYESTDTRDSPRQPAVVRPESVTVDVQDSDSPSPRSDHLPTIPLSGQSLNFESIATRIGSSRLVPSDRGRLTVPAQGQDQDDSLETRSVVSVIPDLQPEIICPPSNGQVNPCRSNGKPDDSHSDPPSKRCRIESLLPAAMFNSGVSALPTTTPDSFIPPNPIPAHLQGHKPQSSTNHDHAPNPSPSLISISKLQNPCHILPLLPLEIHPPLPAISTASFTTHITPTLSMFTTRLKPDQTYKPLIQTRPLHDLERGYWFIRLGIRADMKQSPDPNYQNSEGSTKNPANSEINLARPPQDQDLDSNWTLTFFQRFWSFLEDFVGKDGRAGWGVWCVLEHASNTSSPTVPVPESSASAPLDGSVQMQLKVYAWGEIAMHVYLLLFLASERQVRKMGLQWRDYDEKVVIQMP